MDMPDELEPFYQALTEPQQRAATLLLILNAAASPSYKSQYRRRWWEILETRAKLCAKTSADLTRWSSCLSTRLQGQIGRNKDHRAEWRAALEAGPDRPVLDALEQDTPVVVGFVRQHSDIRSERWEKKQEAKEAVARGDKLTDEQESLL